MGVEAVEKARHLQPDVVLMDLFLPVMDGIAAISTIHRELPETAVIALASLIERSSVIGAIRAGAISYLLKDTQADELRKVIKEVAAGQVYLFPQVSAYLLREIQAPNHQELLTEREMEVLDLLAQGLSNKGIAHTMQIAEDTVKTHVRHILAKFHVQSRTQAILVAMRMGLVSHELTSSLRKCGRKRKEVTIVPYTALLSARVIQERRQPVWNATNRRSTTSVINAKSASTISPGA